MQKKIEVTVISKTGEFIFTRILPHVKARIQHRRIFKKIERYKAVDVQSGHLTTATTTYGYGIYLKICQKKKCQK